MKRILIALLALCPLAAFAATNISVSFLYTQGAANTASSVDHTTVPDRVNAIVTAMNTAYANSGIDIQIVPFFDYGGVTKGSPADSATMQQQFNWAQHSIPALQNKTTTGASFTIMISDPGISVTTGAMPAVLPAYSQNAVAALPYSFLGTQLEYALSTMMGAGTGYSKRARSYNSDQTYHGANVCFHSRESGLSDTSQSVPYLPYFEDTAGGSATQSATAAEACEAYRRILSVGNSSYVTANVPSGTMTCLMYNNVGTLTSTTGLAYNANAGSGPITDCPDEQIPLYSSPLLAGKTPYANGDATHDSVSAMNVRVGTVVNFPNGNALLLSRAKTIVALITGLFVHH